jgi:hypothetical protein
MNWSRLGALGVLLFTAARGAKDHRDRSLAEATFAFVTTAARCVSETEPSTSIRVRSGRACRCEPMMQRVGPTCRRQPGPLGRWRPDAKI